MQFIGLSKDRETDEIIRYELRIHIQDVACLYKDMFGVYICTKQSKMMKVDHTLKYLREELDI